MADQRDPHTPKPELYAPPGGTMAAEKLRQQQEADRRKNNESYRSASTRGGGGTGGCFTGMTEVLTSTGWRPISQIEPGDSVISFSGEGRLAGSRPVLRSVMRHRRRIWSIETTAVREPIATTWCHPFLTQRGWINTWRLRPGDVLQAASDSGDVSANEVLRVHRTQQVDTVYSLITAVDHTFAVRGAIVQNFGYAKALRMAWYRYTEAPEPIYMPAGS